MPWATRDATQLDRILTVDGATGRSPWNAIREDAGRPTLTHLKHLVDRLHWLKTLNVGATAFGTIAHVKVEHFAAEAKSLDTARMLEIQPQKRYTLAAALIRAQVARTLDDLGETLIKRMTKIHHKGQEALADYRRRQQGRTDELITILHELVAVMNGKGSARKMLAAMHAVVGDQAEQILQDCETHAAYADDNYSSLLWRFYKSHRQTLFELLDEIRLATTSRDTAVEDALAFLRSNWTSRRDWLDLDPHKPLDLSWVPDKWWKLVTGSSNRNRIPTAGRPQALRGLSLLADRRRNSSPVTSASRGATSTPTIAASSSPGRSTSGTWPGMENRSACRWRAARSWPT